MTKVSREVFFDMDKMGLLIHRNRKGIDSNYNITSQKKKSGRKGYYVVDRAYEKYAKRVGGLYHLQERSKRI